MKQLDVDGVPAVFGPTTGPMHAGLVFRVGFADEPLARHGITHLIEHLALHSTGVTDYHYNGATGVEFTYFHMQGTETDVVAFLHNVCASLRELPMSRLATEKQILRTEAGGRGTAMIESLALWRYGARAHGVAGYPEWGLHAITPDDLQAWATTYFSRQNAALWIAGDAVPAGLRLDLPDGVRRPPVPPVSALPVRPAYFTGNGHGVGWTSVVRRETRSVVFAEVLERQMYRSLRQTDGVSYTVQTDYEPHADGRATITALADALPEKREAALGGMVDLLAAMRIGRIDPADVTTVVNQRRESLGHAEKQGARLPGQALNLLTSAPLITAEELDEELRAVTAADVAGVAVAAWSEGLLCTPQGTTADWAGYAAAPDASEAEVPGTAYPSLEAPSGRLVVGDLGASVSDGTSRATVRYDALAAMLAWPDGARQLIGDDGMVVRLEPTLYRDARLAVPYLDRVVPRENRVDMPAREAGQIPFPRPAAPAAGVPAMSARDRTRIIIGVVQNGVVAAFFSALTVFMVIGTITDPTDRGASIGPGILFALVAGLCLRRTIRVARRLRRR